ncbi:hypothetical protein ASC89_20305 [Devosia sp. Root413D1]|uniref:DUF883 family protein n=1 Tax=unclassified Devosia TaxID=196773 RepID=UPI0006FC461F|nr:MULTISPECIES: DUF883 family protein [unclassified Devosia]KQU97617.1 hypothetical protein ASC68_12595 [Devosia sp. Root105]KQW77514.1 hypothetical protein ASC89_20305 [Devosia sp. Root413D1]
MASTTDMAPNRTAAAAKAPARRAANGPRRAAARQSQSREDDLSAQVQQLQSDLKSIAATLASLAEDKVHDAQKLAKREVKNLANSGQSAIEDVQDEFGQLEKQIKDTIREKPLTAVAGAIALGFVLAVVSR